MRAVRVADITAGVLAEVNDKELLSLHRRCHQLAGSLFATARERAEDDDEGKLTWEDLVNAHALIVAEMEARKMNHNARDRLDRESARVEKGAVSLEYLKARLAEAQDVVVVENFISIAGSVVQKGERAGDVDLVIRQDRRDTSLEILTRKVFDPEKRGYLHWVYQASGPHADYIPAFDLVLRPKREFKVHTVKAALKPITRYTPTKPRMTGYTEFFSADELWKWASEQDVPLYVSPKVDGFRCIMQKAGGRVSIYFEDSKEERGDELPALAAALEKAPDCIIEGELQAARDGKFLARPQVFSVLAGQLEAQAYVFLYDLLYVEPEGDVHEKSFSERYELLKSLGKKLGEHFVVLPQVLARGKAEFKRAAKEMASWQPFRGADLAIEGVVARRSDMPYTFGPTDDYSKWKTWCEIKVKVVEVNRTENGYVYECALRDDKTGEDVPLGRTFVSKEKLANEGDTLNVMIEELLLYPNGKVAWGKPYPMGPDRSRPAYTVAQAIDVARRGKVLKVIHEGIANKASGTDEERVEASYVRRLRAAGYEVGDGHSVHKVGDSDKGSIYRVNDGYGEWYFLAASERVHFLCVKMADVGAFSAGKLLKGVLTKERVKELGWDTDTWDRALLAWLRGKGEETKKAVPADEGETRGERAEKFWKENWHKLYPKSGKGRFVLHEHWRGLSEDEVNLPREELIRRGHSLHSDLRLESNGTLHGWTVFLGKAEDNATNRLISLPPDDNLQVAPKLAQPKGWLTFEGVSEPGEVGATTGRYARFDIVDSGTYEAGVWREHMMEYFFHGKRLEGRLLVQYAPLGGRRVWIIDRPEDQRPYAETHDLEEVVRELKDKGQKWLIWRKPGEKPRLIDVGAFQLEKQSSRKVVPIAKVDSARQIVYGIVLDPYIVDSQGDWVPVLEVEKAAHRYLVKSRTIGDQHQKKADAELVESWLVPYPTPEDYRKAIDGESHKVYQFKFGKSEVHSGAWVVGIHVISKRLWQEVQSGEKTGLSIGAVGERTRNVTQALPEFEVVEPDEMPVFVAAK